VGACLAIPVLLAVCLVAASCGSVGSGAAQPPTDTGTAASAGTTSSTTPEPKGTKTPSPSPKSGAAKIVFVDVGQGDAIIIKSGSWTGLIDGGPGGSEAAIESSLRKLGVQRLSAVVVSHPHADHTGGLSGVAYDYRPRLAYAGEGAGSAAEALKSVGATITRVRRGDVLRFGNLRAKVLSPASLSGDANADSVVLLLEAGGKRFLFTGDCTGANESLVGSICARGPPLYLLKVSHHGSRYSTDSGFLSEARPKFAVICVGPNSYGHPTPETVAALKIQGTRIYTTQKNGTTTVTVAPSGAVSWAFAGSAKPLTNAGQSTGGGSGGSTTSTGSGGGSEKVFVTETGECYHLGGCRYLSHSKIPISLKDAKARGFRACSVCGPPQ
jgi:competence protein ComEC